MSNTPQLSLESIAQQQKELEMAFAGLKKVFEEVEIKFKQKQQRIVQMLAQEQAKEAANLGQIHTALDQILKSFDGIQGQQGS